MKKCPVCKTKISKYPLLGQPEKTFAENFKDKTIIWKNLFKMDIVHLIFLISIILIIYGTGTYMKDCLVITEDPYAYCGDYCKHKFIEVMEKEPPNRLGPQPPSNMTTILKPQIINYPVN